MANEYSHIPNNHLADALISKIKGVANSKSYAQITSASWSVSEDESSESSESSELDPTPSGGYGFEVTSATAIINQGTTTVTIEVSYDGGQTMALYHINIFKDAEKTQSLVDKGGEGHTITSQLDYMSGLSVGDTIYYDLVREDGSYDTYSGSVVVTLE